jgi:hypothetical protein
MDLKIVVARCETQTDCVSVKEEYGTKPQSTELDRQLL